MKKLILFSCLALFLGFTGCSNDDDDNTPAATTPQYSAKTLLITAKPWKLTSLTLNGADFLSSPLFPSCNKDDLYKFNTDGKITVQDGANTCSQTTPSDGTWSFKNDETAINLVIPSLSFVNGDFELKSLSATTMVLERTSGTSTFVATFTAQ
jgi:hypothetical protein